MSCAFMMYILINRTSRNVALDGRLYFLTSTLLSRKGTHPRTTFLDFYDQTSFLHSLTRTLMTLFTCPRTIRCPQIGPPPNIYIDIYYWAYYTYNSPSKFSSLAPREERRISISLQLPRFYHTSFLFAQVPF